ncbi:MAG: histidine--tRNA ligase [Acidobacteriota bacterium]|nr:histidine--tRNA ligase [Acidobacteriota bacterium]MDQ7088298.1 histidine--tRNA ligase [Acidobacteriota bacterium]
MGVRYQSLRGFSDLLPGETELWQAFEDEARRALARYGFREIRPPHLEKTELFTRSVGEGTDIVGKEMFTFEVSGDSVSLRPELTAQVCRAYIEHGLDRRGLSRLYYIGPAFRKERPQKGRLRQFHQVGVEVFGESAPETDVEVIAVGLETLAAAGVEGSRLLLNSIGDPDSRAAYKKILVESLAAVRDQLCGDCRTRLERNPLRVLDCKVETCRELTAAAPRIDEHLSEDARRHFDAVREGLGKLGIAYEVDPRLVRGLDYYVHTTFEIQAEGLGAQNTVLGGGRYDGLVAQLGGRQVPGIGWAAGIERLLLAAGADPAASRELLDVYLVTLGPRAREGALLLAQNLRAEKLRVGWDTAGHGLGGQMKRAGRSGARFAVLVGDDELERGLVSVKDLASGAQSQAPLEPGELAAWLRRRREEQS